MKKTRIIVWSCVFLGIVFLVTRCTPNEKREILNTKEEYYERVVDVYAQYGSFLKDVSSALALEGLDWISARLPSPKSSFDSLNKCIIRYVHRTESGETISDEEKSLSYIVALDEKQKQTLYNMIYIYDIYVSFASNFISIDFSTNSQVTVELRYSPSIIPETHAKDGYVEHMGGEWYLVVDYFPRV